MQNSSNKYSFIYCLFLCLGLITIVDAGILNASDVPPSILRVGASAVNLYADGKMPLAGMLESGFADKQEGELRAIAIVIEKPGENKIAIVTCDVLWIPKILVDAALKEIHKTTGISPDNILVNATHTHHAPSTSAAHNFGVSERFKIILEQGIIKSVQEANKKLEKSEFYFHQGEENTVGKNSRLKLPDGNITWLNADRELAGKKRIPTGPFDSELPVLSFRKPSGEQIALIYNHSTHTIGTTNNQNVRSPSFYGLAAQQLENELGGIVSFIEGASGSTHNIDGIPVIESIIRMKAAVSKINQASKKQTVNRLISIKKTFKFQVRTFNEDEEEYKVKKYAKAYLPTHVEYLSKTFSHQRDKLKDKQGKVIETSIQVILIGNVALVGVPAEYFTSLGVDIKKRSPFEHTYIAELANDHIGYLPDREAHELGGYQTWMGLHSYAEPGTGERMADEIIKMLEEIHGSPK